MTDQQLKELRDTDLSMNQEGDIVFIKRDRKRTKVFGPVTFKEAMIICWAVMKNYMEEIEA